MMNNAIIKITIITLLSKREMDIENRIANMENAKHEICFAMLFLFAPLN